MPPANDTHPTPTTPAAAEGRHTQGPYTVKQRPAPGYTTWAIYRDGKLVDVERDEGLAELFARRLNGAYALGQSSYPREVAELVAAVRWYASASDYERDSDGGQRAKAALAAVEALSQPEHDAGKR